MDTGDLASHRFLLDALATARPDDAVLSEEGSDDPRRFERDRVWIVDPLDGTNEFGDAGRVDWAVHVALWDSGRLAAGAVSLPAIKAVFATEPAPTLAPRRHDRPRLVTSRTPQPVGRGAGRPGARLRRDPSRVGRRKGDGGGDG